LSWFNHSLSNSEENGLSACLPVRVPVCRARHRQARTDRYARRQAGSHRQRCVSIYLNLFFNLISELYEKASVIITSNKRFDEWAEMMGDEVMTVAMLDRLLHHSKVFNLSGESFRIQKEEED